MAKELGETIDDSELQEMIERADTDNDGLVSEEEFYNIITKKTFAAWSFNIRIHSSFSTSNIDYWSHWDCRAIIINQLHVNRAEDRRDRGRDGAYPEEQGHFVPFGPAQGQARQVEARDHRAGRRQEGRHSRRGLRSIEIWWCPRGDDRLPFGRKVHTANQAHRCESSNAGTFSKIAAYEFTTLTCIPGVLRYKGAKIQLLDLPGIIEGAKDGKGRGKQVIAVARTCNLIIIVLDATRPMGHKKIIEHELEGFGIRLNKRPPEIDFKKKDKGGISISRMVDTDRVSDETIKAILKEYRINNADILIKCDATEDDIIDVIEGNRKYIPCLYALNKIDAITLDELNILDQIEHYVPIAGDLGWNLDELIERMWDYLDLIRVYTKPKGKDPDYETPVIIQRCRATI